MDDLDTSSLKYLAGLNNTISECGMMPTSASPHTPASINITASSGDELTNMLKALGNIASDDAPADTKDVLSTEPVGLPSTKIVTAPPMSHGNEMQKLLAMMDQEVDEDSMNPDDQRDWNNSPDEEGKAAGNWPIDGDQDNDTVAAKDELVKRHDVTYEGLMKEYEQFIEEGFKPLLPKQKAAQHVQDRERMASKGLAIRPGQSPAEAARKRKEIQNSISKK